MLHQNFVAVDELAPRLCDSVQTARLDINKICDMNDNKHASALATAGLIPEGNTIAISVGTAPMTVADVLADKIFGNHLTDYEIFGIGGVMSNRGQMIPYIKALNDFAELLEWRRERLKLTGGAL